MRSFPRIRRIILACCALVPLGGCTGALIGAANQVLLYEDVNIASANYAAADYLAHQAKFYIEPYETIDAEPLINLKQPEIPTLLGRVIPEQVGIRLAQLGYSVSLDDVRTENMAVPGAPAGTPLFVLAGKYNQVRKDIEVNLTITRLSDKRIVAAFNYVLPLNREIAGMNEPAPRITRIDRR